MTPETQEVLIALSSKGFSQAELARYLTEKMGNSYSHYDVNRALHMWVPRQDTKRIPRGKTMQILLTASDIIGRPVTPVIASQFKQRQT